MPVAPKVCMGRVGAEHCLNAPLEQPIAGGHADAAQYLLSQAADIGDHFFHSPRVDRRARWSRPSAGDVQLTRTPSVATHRHQRFGA